VRARENGCPIQYREIMGIPTSQFALDPLKRFKELLGSGWKIREIHYKYESEPVPVLRATATLTRGTESEVIQSQNDEFTSHVMSYRSLPNLATGTVEFTYIEDTERYHYFEQNFFEFTCGIRPYLTIAKALNPPSKTDRKRIAAGIDAWIDSERTLTRIPTKLPRLFYDVIVLFSSNGKFDCLILEKDAANAEEFAEMTRRVAYSDWAYAFSVVFACPKIAEGFNRDAVILLALYDLKSRQTAGACVGTIRSILNHAGRRLSPGTELLEVVDDLRQRAIREDSWSFILVAPFRDSEFTPVPWIAYALLDQRLVRRVDELPALPMREIILFGDAGIPRVRSSLDFKRKPQTTALILDVRHNTRSYDCVIHFDRSQGETSFHVDLQVYPLGSACSYKLIEHEPVLLRNVWDISQNLYLAFVAAGAFDMRFDALITKDIKDFNELIKEEPLAVYPLIYRGYIEPKEKWLAANPDTLGLLKKIWNDEGYVLAKNETAGLQLLESQGLLDSGKLTNQAIWILSRSQL
jgi:hypothetical protein